MNGSLALGLVTFTSMCAFTLVGLIISEYRIHGSIDIGRLKVSIMVSVVTGLVAAYVLATTTAVQG